jgi:hypothetical protein
MSWEARMTIDRIRVVALLAVLALPSVARPVDLDPHLAPLKPLLGKTWRGVFPNSTPEKPVIDISRYEAVLNGQAVRNLHSINDGAYGGETLIVWDKEKQALVYYYFTTGGFYTTGTLHAEEGAFQSHEVVKGDADGVSEVKATFRLLPDGRLHAKTQYLRQGKWVDARDMHYVEAPGAIVRFKD